jgi:thiol-disulfide isomerase/thioredoxin
MKYYLLFTLSFISIALFSQDPITYKNEKGDVHLLGSVDRSEFVKGPYAKWYDLVYKRYTVNKKGLERLNKEYDKKVKLKIYLGTWCGDSKREVTRFLKIVDQSKINMNNVELICLDDRDDVYKQGPNGEEKGLNIHRVPTFIFYKNEKEVGRIVESPVNSLETDISQIYAGIPSKPNYRMANHIAKLLKEMPVDSVEQFITKNIRYMKRFVKNEGELNTMGYVLLAAKKQKEALLVFKLNTLFFPESWNTFDSLGEAQMKAGDYVAAVDNYLKVMQMDQGNEHAQGMLKKIYQDKS